MLFTPFVPSPTYVFRPPEEPAVIVISRVKETVVALPAVSVNEPDPTVITAVPVVNDDDAVNVAVYVVPLPEMELSVPNVALTSPVAKEVVASVELNVIDTVPPAATVVAAGLIVIVGTTPSTTMAFAAAMLLEMFGIVVDVIALPAVSATVPIVKLETVKSEDD